jgi:hypothetical protein
MEVSRLKVKVKRVRAVLKSVELKRLSKELLVARRKCQKTLVCSVILQIC